MPLVTGTFGPTSKPDGPVRPAGPRSRPAPQPSAVIIAELHDELAAVGLPVGAKERGNGVAAKFGSGTSTRLKEFQQRFGLPADGKLTPETGGVLSLAAAVASEADRAKLRAELNGAVGAVPDSPRYDYWLERHALMAGDPGLAARVNPQVFDDLFGNDLGVGVFTDGSGNAQPQKPEV